MNSKVSTIFYTKQGQNYTLALIKPWFKHSKKQLQDLLSGFYPWKNINSLFE
jgi:hypothetical protein